MEITEHDKKYWQYEYDVVSRYLLPLLRTWDIKVEGARVLDVGCGDGGGVSAMYDAGMTCEGFDISQRRVELANALRGGRDFEMTIGNIYHNPPPFAGETFDLVVLHDVFEHLEEKPKVLEILKTYLNPTGKLLITFPPFYSAFGAHQHLLRSRLGNIPFVHLVPFVLTRVLPRLNGEHALFVEEIQKLGRLRMGIARFERFVRTAKLRIENAQFYIVGPNHIRFGLRPMKAGILGRIPLLREVLISGAVYLLSNPQGEPLT